MSNGHRLSPRRTYDRAADPPCRPDRALIRLAAIQSACAPARPVARRRPGRLPGRPRPVPLCRSRPRRGALAANGLHGPAAGRLRLRAACARACSGHRRQSGGRDAAPRRSACRARGLLPVGTALEQRPARHGPLLCGGEPVRARVAPRRRVLRRAALARVRQPVPGRVLPGRHGEPLRDRVQGAAHRAGRPVRALDGRIGGVRLHVRARRTAPGGCRRARPVPRGALPPAEGDGLAAAGRGERGVRRGRGSMLRLVAGLLRPGGGVRVHGGRLGREGVVRRAGLGALLP